MTGHRDDAGLLAVQRVRVVREQDSRTGLRLANSELDQARGQLAVLEDSLRRMSPADSTVATFVATRTTLIAIGTRVSQARAGVELCRGIAEEARVRWQADRTRVEAVQMLLERRAARRRAEAARREARTLDDLAGQAWQRRQNAEARR